jgi:hypothetical protein
MTTLEIAIPLGIGGLIWFWFDSFAAREAGLRAVRQACEEDGLQLLDETISLASLKPQRNETGRLDWARVYNFEFTTTGDNRRRGRVHLLGRRVVLLNMGPRLVVSNPRRD